MFDCCCGKICWWYGGVPWKNGGGVSVLGDLCNLIKDWGWILKLCGCWGYGWISLGYSV